MTLGHCPIHKGTFSNRALVCGPLWVLSEETRYLATKKLPSMSNTHKMSRVVSMCKRVVFAKDMSCKIHAAIPTRILITITGSLQVSGFVAPITP